jgi:hypothetical protein
MYHVVAWVNRPRNVLLAWSARECDAFIPTTNRITPITRITIPNMRCEVTGGSYR